MQAKCYAGPLSGYSSNFLRLKTAGFSVTYTPTASDNNNAGSVIFGYFPSSSISNLVGNTSANVSSAVGQSIGTNAIT